MKAALEIQLSVRPSLVVGRASALHSMGLVSRPSLAAVIDLRALKIVIVNVVTQFGDDSSGRQLFRRAPLPPASIRPSLQHLSLPAARLRSASARLTFPQNLKFFHKTRRQEASPLSNLDPDRAGLSGFPTCRPVMRRRRRQSRYVARTGQTIKGSSSLTSGFPGQRIGCCREGDTRRITNRANNNKAARLNHPNRESLRRPPLPLID